MAELFTNFATSSLASGISSSDTSLSVQSGDGSLFPSPTGSDFFRAVLFKKSTGETEIVKVTARSSDVFTITRAQEGTTALTLLAGDIVELRPTAAFFTSLNVTSTEIQNDGYNTAGADTGSANVYQVSLTPAPTSYTDGLVVTFDPANTNTGASTINVNSLGAQSIVRWDGGALAAGDITAGRPTTVRYDGTNFRLQQLVGGFSGNWTVGGDLTVSGDHKVSSTTPKVQLEETDAGSNEKIYDLLAAAGVFSLRTRTDADGAGNTVFQVSRSGTAVSEVNFVDNEVTRPRFKDWAETRVSANSGSSYTVNMNNGNVYEVTLTANCTFTFSNPPASGRAGSFTLILKQDGTGSRTVTWPASVKWPAGTAPTLSTGANDVDILSFATTDGGSTWYGVSAGLDFS